MVNFLVLVHLTGVVGLALYGMLGFVTLWLYLRHRREDYRLPEVADADWPSVTVQLPIYNERYVVERLIAAAAALDYPGHRLQIQVLDDSTDDTTAVAAASVDQWRSAGVDIALIHRPHRVGYKGGALAAGLQQSRGELIAIFDADFIPEPSFLRHLVPYFLGKPRLGAVQARWGHLNAAHSSLTAAQAVALDKHFAVEQLVRHRADCFPKFNGSAGIWRRACIEDVGGWQADTACEDLCLSTRAVLAGWRFHFANATVAPAELPTTILAYQNQQARWAMGATQCLTKYALPIWRAPGQTLLARLYALLTMSAYMTHLLLLALVLVQLPLILSGYRFPPWMVVFSLIGLGQPLLFVVAQQILYSDWVRRLRNLPTLLLIAIGTAPSNAAAVLKGLLGRNFIFFRTPKGAGPRYRLRAGPILWVEAGLTAYCALALWLAVQTGNTGSVLLLFTCLLGFGHVARLGWVESHQP